MIVIDRRVFLQNEQFQPLIGVTVELFDLDTGTVLARTISDSQGIAAFVEVHIATDNYWFRPLITRASGRLNNLLLGGVVHMGVEQENLVLRVVDLAINALYLHADIDALNIGFTFSDLGQVPDLLLFVLAEAFVDIPRWGVWGGDDGTNVISLDTESPATFGSFDGVNRRPIEDDLLILAIHSDLNTAPYDVTSLTGSSLTWTIRQQLPRAGHHENLLIATAPVPAGFNIDLETVTINFSNGTTNPLDGAFFFSLQWISGVNLADPVEQIVTKEEGSSASTSVTFAAFASALNMGIVVFNNASLYFTNKNGDSASSDWADVSSNYGATDHFMLDPTDGMFGPFAVWQEGGSDLTPTQVSNFTESWWLSIGIELNMAGSIPPTPTLSSDFSFSELVNVTFGKARMTVWSAPPPSDDSTYSSNIVPTWGSRAPDRVIFDLDGFAGVTTFDDGNPLQYDVDAQESALDYAPSLVAFQNDGNFLFAYVCRLVKGNEVEDYSVWGLQFEAAFDTVGNWEEIPFPNYPSPMLTFWLGVVRARDLAGPTSPVFSNTGSEGARPGAAAVFEIKTTNKTKPAPWLN
jgi:hypothetical protein